jgi:hypothetical protein
MELIIPEVVKGELKYQHTNHVLKKLYTANKNFEEISDVTGQDYKHRITKERIKKDVETKFSSFLKNYKAVVVPTPIHRISWDKMVKSSIWRIPPFVDTNKKEEKGFRDALILETIIHYCKSLSRYETVSFICNDRILRESAEGAVTHRNFNVYDTLKSYESILALRKENIEAAFIRKISRRARNKFFKRFDFDSLYLRDKIAVHLREKYKEDIDDPQELTTDSGILTGLLSSQLEPWEPTNSGKFWISRPTFDKVENKNEDFWTSVVNFVRIYKRKDVLVGNQKIEFNQNIIHILPFHVSWWSKLSIDGKFLEYKYLSEEIKDPEFRIITDNDKQNWKLD